MVVLFPRMLQAMICAFYLWSMDVVGLKQNARNLIGYHPLPVHTSDLLIVTNSPHTLSIIPFCSREPHSRKKWPWFFWPDDPYPVEIKPPLPDDALVDTRVTTTSNSKDSPYNTPNNLLERTSSYCQATKHANNCMLQRRFKHVFHDMRGSKYQGQCCGWCASQPACQSIGLSQAVLNSISIDHVAENIGVRRLFNEAGAYFDNATQKLQISEPPKNKVARLCIIVHFCAFVTISCLAVPWSTYSFNWRLKNIIWKFYEESTGEQCKVWKRSCLSTHPVTT